MYKKCTIHVGLIYLLTLVHIFVYNKGIKKRNIEKRLKKCGWWFERHGGNHDIWTNGEFRIPVPRHRKVNKRAAKGIIKEVEANKV